MTEAQLVSLALTTVPTMIVVLIGVLLNNVRLNDVKETLRAEIKVVEANMEKNHSEMLHRFADLDGRISNLDGRMTRIENSLGLDRS